jgi:hypothetical protein
MANSVFIGIAAASIALALTASVATPSKAMSFSDYDGSAAPLGSRAEISELFSGRLTAQQNRRARQAEALKEIREGRTILPAFSTTQTPKTSQRPISLTLPF